MAALLDEQGKPLLRPLPTLDAAPDVSTVRKSASEPKPEAVEPSPPSYRKWDEIEQDEAFKALPSREQEAARQEYFTTVVAPQLGDDEVMTAKKEFDQLTRSSTLGRVAHDAKRTLDVAADVAGPVIDRGLSAIGRGVKQAGETLANPPPVQRLSPPAKMAQQGVSGAGQYDPFIEEAAKTYKVPAADLRAMLNVESSGNPDATSAKGAQGLMQLMPGTAAEMGVTNPNDPRQNILGGARYYRKMLDRYKGNRELAIAAYNAGPGTVDKAGGVPSITETRNHVAKVMGRAAADQGTRTDMASGHFPGDAHDHTGELMPFLQGGKNAAHVRGLNSAFQGRLAAMLKDAPAGVQIMSGYRSPERQTQLWQAALAKYGSPEAARKWVAPPGHSNHNHGIASDLTFANDQAKQWVHENAKKYGLNFRMAHEGWHIEPIEAHGDDADWAKRVGVQRDPTARDMSKELYGLALKPGYVDTVRAKYDAASPAERAAMISGNDVESRVARYVDDGYRQATSVTDLNAELAGFGTRREDRANSYLDQGFDRKTANQLANEDLLLGRDTRRLQEPERPSLLDQVKTDWQRGVLNTQAMGAGLGAWARDVTGNEEKASELLRDYQDLTQEAAQYAPVIGDFDKIGEQGLAKVPEDVARYMTEAIVGNLPNFLPSLALGGVGGLAARRATQGIVNNLIEKLGAAKAAEFVAAKTAQAAQGFGRIGATAEAIKAKGAAELAQQGVTAALKNQAAKTAMGAAAGAGAASVGMETGSIYGDIYDQTGQMRPGVAGAAGLAAGALDAIPAMRAATKLVGPAVTEAVAGTVMSRLGKEAGIQFLSESGTEFMQTLVENGAVHVVEGKPLVNEQDVHEALNAALQGGIAGSATGVATQGLSEVRGAMEREPSTAAQLGAALQSQVDRVREGINAEAIARDRLDPNQAPSSPAAMAARGVTPKSEPIQSRELPAWSAQLPQESGREQAQPVGPGPTGAAGSADRADGGADLLSFAPDYRGQRRGRAESEPEANTGNADAQVSRGAQPSESEPAGNAGGLSEHESGPGGTAGAVKGDIAAGDIDATDVALSQNESEKETGANAWENLSVLERENWVAKAGWGTKKGAANAFGKKLAQKPWVEINPEHRAKLADALTAAPISASETKAENPIDEDVAYPDEQIATARAGADARPAELQSSPAPQGWDKAITTAWQEWDSGKAVRSRLTKAAGLTGIKLGSPARSITARNWEDLPVNLQRDLAKLYFKPENQDEKTSVSIAPSGGAADDPSGGAQRADAVPISSESPAKETVSGETGPATAQAGLDREGESGSGALNWVEHTTGKGKTIRGIVRKDLTVQQAKAIDPFTFKKDGGFFIREKHVLADRQDGVEVQNPKFITPAVRKAFREWQASGEETYFGEDGRRSFSIEDSAVHDGLVEFGTTSTQGNARSAGGQKVFENRQYFRKSDLEALAKDAQPDQFPDATKMVEEAPDGSAPATDKDSLTVGATPEESSAVDNNSLSSEMPATPEATPATPEAQAATDDMADLKAQMGQAIGELAALLGAKSNLTEEEETRLIPIMSKIFRIAAKMGYIQFKEAGRHVMQQIRELAGNEIADKLSIDNLQAGYINIASEIGGDKKAALTVESIEELMAEGADPMTDAGKRWDTQSRDERLAWAQAGRFDGDLARIMSGQNWADLTLSQRANLTRDSLLKELTSDKASPADAIKKGITDRTPVPDGKLVVGFVGDKPQAQEPVKIEDRDEYPLGRFTKEDRYFGTRVRVLPDIRGDAAWEGTVYSVLNGGRLFEVRKDGQDFQVRISGQRIEVLEVVDSGEPESDKSPNLTDTSTNRPTKRVVSKQAVEASDADRETTGTTGGTSDAGPSAGSAPRVDGERPAGGVSGRESGGNRGGGRGTAGTGNDQDTGVRSGTARTAATSDRNVSANLGTSAANVPDVPRGNDYRIPAGGLTREGSWLDTARRNVEIVELVHRLESENRPATPEEQAQLVKFTGWGAADIRNQLFPGKAKSGRRYDPSVLSGSWKELGQRVAEVFTADDWKTALRSTQYAHYTSEEVVRAAWQGAERLGFAGGAILEPGAGIGHFAGLMPDGIYRNSRYLGIEQDGFTARIAQLLYPGQTLRHADYVRNKVPRAFFDLAIGNPPFANTPIVDDPEYARQKFPLHDYFFAKSMDRVRPGGLLIFVTSRFTLDKQGDKARRYLADRADLLGAIRLPNTAFKANAGTQVVTDVLFLRKRDPSDTATAGESWLGLAEVTSIEGDAVPVNEYFARHPEMILGQITTKGDTLNPGEAFTLNPLDDDLAGRLAEAIQRLPQNVYSVADPAASTTTTQKTAIEKDWNPKYRKEGGVYLSDAGELMRVENGVGVALADQMKLSAKEKEWLTDYVPLREALKQAQYDQLAEGNWQASLKALNKAYDAFVKKHGPIMAFTESETTKLDADGEEEIIVRRRYKNDRMLKADIDGKSLVFALEKITEDGAIVKAAILKDRVLKRPAEPKIESVDDALAVSLAQAGRFDLAHVARLAGMEPEQALRDLGDLVYEAPGGGQVLAEEYLSGDVRTKLDEAEAAAAIDRRFARNVEALSRVQPPSLVSSDVTVGLGATWVPMEYYQQYAQEVVGLASPTVTYHAHSNEFEIASNDRRQLSRKESAEWGTKYRSPLEIFDAAMNRRTVKVYVGAGTKDDPRKLDPEETKKVETLVRRMEENFSSWVWTDAERTGKLLDIYNEKFNRLAPRFFNGDHIQPPGLSLKYTLHPHQKRAIWRAIVTGNTYFAHAVGAGKTLEMIIAGMEQKRLGLIKKPMYVVPNHMLEQFAAEFLEAYPAANIMVADQDNFAADNRRRFIAQASLNNPDAIVITHSAFTILEMKPENQAAAFDDVIDDLRASLEELPDDFENKKTRSKIEAQLERIERAMSGASSEKFTQRRKLESLQAALAGEKKKEKPDPVIVKKLQADIAEQEPKARKEELNAERDKSIVFEDMGVDFLFVDEAHEFRKLDYATKMNVKGLSPEGSVMALKLFVKTRWLEKQRKGRSFAFASGTPITNTMAELFTIQRFFQEDELRAKGLIHFDAWAANFARVKTEYERNATGGWEGVDRMSKFVNVADLMTMMRQHMDVLTSSELAHLVKLPTPVPGNAGKRNIIVTPQVPELEAYMNGELSDRLEASRKWKPTKEQPNNPDPVIAIITDGRVSALDMRYIDPSLPNNPDSKLNKLADRIIEHHRETANLTFTDPDTGKIEPIKGGTQIVFASVGFGPGIAKSRGFDGRAWLNKRLKEAGIPSSEVAWIWDYPTPAAKQAMFKEMRQGKKRILIGSPKNMGTGVNVQKRLTHKIDLDSPWYPSDMEQPDGRILRQGNQNEFITLEGLATDGTYDSTMYSMVARKSSFIEQAFRGDRSLRVMDDISESSGYAMAAAIASGDPRYVQMATLESDVAKLEGAKELHDRRQVALRRDISGFKRDVPILRKQVETAQRVAAALQGSFFYSGRFGAVVDGREFRGMKSTELGEEVANVLDREMQKAMAAAERLALGDQRSGKDEHHGPRHTHEVEQVIGKIDGKAELVLLIEADAARVKKDGKLTDEVSRTFRTGGTVQLRVAGQLQHVPVDTWRFEQSLNRHENTGRAITGQLGELQYSAVAKAKKELDDTLEALEKAEKGFGTPFPQQAELVQAVTELANLRRELSAEGKEVPEAAVKASVLPDFSLIRPVQKGGEIRGNYLAAVYGLPEEARDETPKFSRAGLMAGGSDQSPIVQADDQTAAGALNRGMVRYFGDKSWENAYVQVELPDALSGLREAVATGFGRELVGIFGRTRGSRAINGINYQGKLYLNVNADVGFVQLGGHELLHQLKRDRPDLYRWFAGQARGYYKNFSTYQDKLNALLKPGESPYNKAAAEEELLADFAGDALADPQFVERLAKADPGRFRQLLKAVMDWLKQVGDKLSGKGLGSSEYFTDVETLRNYLADTLVAYGQGGSVAIRKVEKPKFSSSFGGETHGAQLQKEYEDTRARYINTPQWLKAPNGQPSNLNEQQWVMVRTPRFKAWFGDWEALARQAKVKELIQKSLDDKSWQQRTVLAEGYDADPSGKLSEAFGFDVVRQYLTPDDIRKTDKRHGDGKERNKDQIGLKQEDYVKALEVLRNPETYKLTTSNNGKPSAEFGRTFSDGMFIIAEVEIAETGSVSIKSAWKKLPGRNHAGGTPYPIRTPEDTAGSKQSIGSDSLIVNQESVSKVVDENGEPLVVYRSDATEIAKFDKRKARDGFFFHESEEATKSYGGTPRAYYLKITNPLVTERALPNERNASDVKGTDFDGLVNERSDGREFIATQPNQVKSATGNTGTFSPDSADIRFSRRSDLNNYPDEREGSGIEEDPEARFDEDPEALFADIDDAIRKGGGWNEAKGELEKRWNKLNASARRQWLGALTVHQLVELGGKVLPRMERYLKEMTGMDVTRNKVLYEVDAIAKDWEKLDKQALGRLAHVMHESTLAGVDGAEDYVPSIDKKDAIKQIGILKRRMLSVPGDDKWPMLAEIRTLKKQIRFEERREQAYAGIQRMFQALPEDAKDVYVRSRDYHVAQSKRVEQALVEMIEKTQMSGKQRAAAVQKLRTEFEAQRVNAPYFPLSRKGDYWVYTAPPKNSESKAGAEFHMFQTLEEQTAFIQESQAAGMEILGRGKQLENLQETIGVPGSFVAQVEDIIGQLGEGHPLVESVRDQVYQLYLQTLPDLSARKHFIHRKKTPGFGRDALRAFATKGYHDAYQYARVKHGFEMRSIMEKLREDLDVAGSKPKMKALKVKRDQLEEFRDEVLNAGMGYQAVKERAEGLGIQEMETRAQAGKRRLGEGEQFVADEAKKWKQFLTWMDEWKRYGGMPDRVNQEIADIDLRIRTSRLINTRERGYEFGADVYNELQAAYAWLMNPKTAPWATAMNQMGYLYNLAFSPSAWATNATQNPLVAMPYVAAKHGVKNTTAAFTQAYQEAFRGALSKSANKEHALGIRESLSKPDEIQAYDWALEAGLIERGRAMDLAGTAEEGQDRSAWHRKFSMAMTVGFHDVERLNRETSFMASYRLARKAGQDFAGAVDYAGEVVNKTHLVYASENRPRFMRSDVARVLLQFKLYSQGISYLLGKSVVDAVGKNASAEEKAEAKRFLAFQFGMQAAAAGTLGLPIGLAWWAAQAAFGALFDDDDDPKELEPEFREALAEALGTTGGEAAAKGLVNALLPIDLHSRIGMRELWFRENDREAEGKDAASRMMSNLMGPMAGIMENLFVGSQMVSEGHVYRGIEKMMPKFIRDPLKALRYESEGVQTLKGDPLIDDLSTGEFLGQLLGFSPSRLNERYDENNAEKNRQQRIEERRQKLTGDLAQSRIDGAMAQREGDDRKLSKAQSLFEEAMANAKRFNEKQPGFAIGGKTVGRSIQSRVRARAMAKDGIFLNRKIPERYDYATPAEDAE